MTGTLLFLLILTLFEHGTCVVESASVEYTFGGASVVPCDNINSQCSPQSKQIVWQWQWQQQQQTQTQLPQNLPRLPQNISSHANISRSLQAFLVNSNSVALGGIAASAAIARTPDHARSWFISRDALHSTHDATTVYGSFFSVAYRSSDDSVHVLARSCASVTCKVCLLFAPAQVLPALNTAEQMQQARCFSGVGGDEKKIFEFLTGGSGEIVAHRTANNTATLYDIDSAVELSISPLDFVTSAAVVVVPVSVPSLSSSSPTPSPYSSQTTGTTMPTTTMTMTPSTELTPTLAVPSAPRYTVRNFVIEPNAVYLGVYTVDSATLAYTNAMLASENLAHFSAIYIGGTLTITLPEDFLADAQHATDDELTLSLFSYDNVYGKFDALVIDDALGTRTSCQSIYAEEVENDSGEGVFQVALHIDNVCRNAAQTLLAPLICTSYFII